jgi:hypothetical protein
LRFKVENGIGNYKEKSLENLKVFGCGGSLVFGMLSRLSCLAAVYF